MRNSILVLILSVSVYAANAPLKKHNTRPLQAESSPAAFDAWETPIPAFFIRSHHEVPEINPAEFVLVVDGLVEKPLRLSLADLQRYSEKSLHAVLECSGNGRGLQRPRVSGVQWEKGAIGNAEWSGVRLAEILKAAGPKTNAKFVRVEGADKPALPSIPAFVRSIPIQKALDDKTLLAWKMNREPMPLLHGGPLRLILPGWYGQNWIKWVTHLTVSDSEDTGFYMKKGYRMPRKNVKPGQAWDSSTGIPIQQLLVQSFVVQPREGAEVTPGKVEISGKAFSGAGTISKVEISVDSGKHWVAATVEKPHEDGGWQEFQLAVEMKKLGAVRILARATDSAGYSQPLQPTWNPAGYLRNTVDVVAFKVVKKPRLDASELVESKCLTCHSSGLIEGQQLTVEAWGKSIDKMKNFGAKISDEEKATLAKYLAAKTPTTATDIDYAEASSIYPSHLVAGDSGRGKALYTQYCGDCHGKEVEGGTGPRLQDRAVPVGNFYSAVLYGKAAMPAFGESLDRQAIADIRAYFLRQ